MVKTFQEKIQLKLTVTLTACIAFYFNRVEINFN